MYRLALNGISGMIVVPAIGGVNNPMVVPALTAVGIHVVSCFRPLVNHFMPGAYGNSFQAGYIGTKHLLERGCRKIAFFSSPMYQGAYERYQGYLTALRERGGEEAEPLLSCETSFQYEQGLDAAARLLEEEPDMDSIFAFNDRIAREAYGLLARHGRRPGRDVLLVGCDNTGICNELSPKLSSISYPLQQIGQSSARMLWQLASASREEGSRLDIFGCSLIARESSVSDGPQPSA